VDANDREKEIQWNFILVFGPIAGHVTDEFEYCKFPKDFS